MSNRLNYRKLLTNWMQYYDLPAEEADKLFASIWTRLQASKEKTDDIGADQDAETME